METVAQTTQNICNFMAGKSSLQEIGTLAIIREISDSNLETGRRTVQNLESPGLCRRFDSTAFIHLQLRQLSNVLLKS